MFSISSLLGVKQKGPEIKDRCSVQFSSNMSKKNRFTSKIQLYIKGAQGKHVAGVCNEVCGRLTAWRDLTHMLMHAACAAGAQTGPKAYLKRLL